MSIVRQKNKLSKRRARPSPKKQPRPPFLMGHYVIIGGGGFLGTHIISKLQSENCQRRIYIVDPHPRTFETINIDMRYVTIIKVRVLDRWLPCASAVFHLASIGHTGLIGADKKSVFDFNVEGTKLLVEKCKKYGVSRLLYASSVAVAFVGDPLHNASEDDPLPDPSKYIDFYSASKAEAERFVLNESSETFKTMCLRFRAIYGPEDPNVTEKVARLIRRRLFIGMVSVHGRESISASSSVVNCANAFYCADRELQKPEGLHGREYFITDANNQGQYEFWEPLVRALGQTPPSRFIPHCLMTCFVRCCQFFCYNVCRISPLLTKFELAILATDNTYSNARAQREIGYIPEPCLMPAVADYYRRRAETDRGWTLNWAVLMFLAVVIILLALVVVYRS
ncbi:unnamed protein product [Caenorhabditis sp. 36 PRJEB53466]|nr:unnamed protein product [Caenorhabditis sp. 36 PRJEB53466]